MESQQTALGFGDYLAALGRRRALILGIAVPIAALTLLLVVALPDIYRSEAFVEIDEPKVENRIIQEPQSGEQTYADQYVQSLKGVVLSDANLEQLASEFGLYPQHRDDAGALLRRLRRDIDVDIVTTPILDPRTGREREVVSAFTLAYDSRDPDKAQAVARWLVDAFFAEHRRQRRERAASVAQFFAGEAERMREHLTSLEAKLAEFKKANYGRLPELTEVNMNMMDRTERDLEQLQLQAQTLRQERVFLVSQLQQTRAAGPDAGSLRGLEEEYTRKSMTYDQSHPDMISLRRQIDSLKGGGTAPGGGTLREQLAAKRGTLAEARRRYSPDHPDVRRLNREIASLEARIGAGENADQDPAMHTPVAVQLQTQVNAIDSQLASIAARGAELRGKLSNLEGLVVSAPQVEREYQTVTRDLTIGRTKYEQLLNRQLDAEVREAAIAGGGADEFRLTQPPARSNEPAKPPRPAILIIGLILAAVLGLTGAVFAEGLDQSVRGARDVRDVLALSPLVAVPDIRNSVTRRRQAWRFAAAATCTVLFVWIMFAAVQMWL
jgi:succinoglycan biosynthesis transport protein ExoP